MAYSNTIAILIAAKDEASAVLAKTAASTKAATGEMNSMGTTSTRTGSLLTTGIAAGLIAVVGESTNLAIKFQQDMEVLHTNAGVAQSDIAGLSQKLIDMAGSVGQGPDALAQAFYHIASAGTGIWDTAKELDILKIAAEGAAIGQSNLDDTTYALTSAMASGISGVKDAAGMMAVLNATVGAGDMKLQDLNGALSTGILSTAATFGISIQSVGTALATLTDNGEHADEAATRLRMTFALMGSPSSQAAKQLQALGLTAEDAKVATTGMNKVFQESGLTTTKLADDLRQPNGITMAMKDLKDHLEAAGLSASEADAMLSKAFGGGRTDAALLTMLQNVDRMDEKFKVINQNASKFSSNFADQQQTASQKIQNAWASIQAALIQVGSQTLPYVGAAFKFLGDNINVLLPILTTLGIAFVAVKTAMLLQSAFTAVSAGLALLASSSIPAATMAYAGLAASIAAPIIMPAIAIGAALAAIAVLVNAWQGAMSAINQSNNASKSLLNQDSALLAKYSATLKDPKASFTDKSNAQRAMAAIYSDLAPAHALGTNFASGGLSLVGENGPELVSLPRGSQVNDARKTSGMLGSGGTTINLGGVTVNNNMDLNKMLTHIGWKLATR